MLIVMTGLGVWQGDITDECSGTSSTFFYPTIECPRSFQTRTLAALIAWMLFLRGDDGVKGGPKGPPP